MSVARDLFDLRMAGLYLPSLVLLTVDPSFPGKRFVVFFSLLAAVYFHGVSRNVFGVGGPEENPLKREEAIRGFQVAITGKGPHKEHPETIHGIFLSVLRYPSLLSAPRFVFLLFGVVSLVVWLPSVALSLYFGITQLEQLGTGSKLLLFAEGVWVLQWAVWRFYTPSYLLDEDDFE